jgi:hypothetical protein
MKILLATISIILATSCSFLSSENTIIDQDTMVDVLVDIHLADAILGGSSLRINRDTLEIKMYYDNILMKHHITQKQIDNSLKHYAKDIKKFEDIYLQVSEKLSKMESEYQKNATLEKEKIKQDTLINDTSDLE